MSLSVEKQLDMIAPEFKSNPDKSDWITMATCQVSSCFYGKNKNYAIALMTAHMMTLALLRPGGGDGGSITSKREGDLAIGFSSPSNFKNDDLNQTKYGIQLQGLKKSSGVFIGVTGGLDNGCPC